MSALKSFFRSYVKVLCLLAFLLCAVVVFYFSSESRVHALSCTGNYYYTSQEIYRLAGINSDFRTWTPAAIIENRLKNVPLIESVSVDQDGQNYHIDVSERMVLGYYIKDGDNYMLTRDGDSILVESKDDIKNLIHFPLLADLSEEQMKQMAAEFQKYPEHLTRDLVEKIAEVRPWSESYDNNMLKMVMQDGNEVFTSIDSLHMITNYQKMLTALQGENVCLVLDGENQTIDKIACEYMFMSSEERDQYRSKQKQDAIAKQEAEEKSKQQQEQAASQQADHDQPSHDAAANSQASQPSHQQPDAQQPQTPDASQNQPAVQPETPDMQPVPDPPAQDTPSTEVQNPVNDLINAGSQASDWQASEFPWMSYSPSTGLYQDLSGNLYTWNTTSLSFDLLQ